MGRRRSGERLVVDSRRGGEERTGASRAVDQDGYGDLKGALEGGRRGCDLRVREPSRRRSGRAPRQEGGFSALQVADLRVPRARPTSNGRDTYGGGWCASRP